MKKFLKPGRVVIMLSGKHAGKKAVILKVIYEGPKNRRFTHCLVAGISRYPRKVTGKMDDKRIARRTTIKPFVKYVNFNHFLPTRYVVSQSLDVKQMINYFDDKISTKNKEHEKNRDPLKNDEIKTEFKKKIRKIFEDKYRGLDLNDQSQENQIVKFLFKPL